MESTGKAVAHGRTIFYSSWCSQVRQPLTWQGWSISFLQMPSLASICKQQSTTNLKHPKSSYIYFHYLSLWCRSGIPTLWNYHFALRMRWISSAFRPDTGRFMALNLSFSSMMLHFSRLSSTCSVSSSSSCIPERVKQGVQLWASGTFKDSCCFKHKYLAICMGQKSKEIQSDFLKHSMNSNSLPHLRLHLLPQGLLPSLFWPLTPLPFSFGLPPLPTFFRFPRRLFSFLLPFSFFRPPSFLKGE